MASPNQPLLSSPIGGSSSRSSFPCKALLFSLSLAAVFCLALRLTLPPATTGTLQASDLCTNSPNPTTCHSIVSDILTLSSPKPTPLHVFNSLVAKSINQIKSAELEITKSSGLNGQQQALADCAQLMDMSLDRLAGSVSAAASGAHADARTWLSAALANHVTCLEGLSGPAKAELQLQLRALINQASASLAVLSSISRQSDGFANEQVLDFPSWMSFRDRKLLQSSGITANAVVAQDGTGKFKKVQDAVTAAPNKSSSRYVIYVKKGVYKENVVIPKSKTNLMIVGDGMTATILTGSLNVVDGATTFNSATLAANADGLILQDLGIQNTAGAIKHQAVALRVSADHSAINRCEIDGYQDTLYTHSLRQFYRDSTISGTIDFIFGDSAVVLQNCNVVARRPLSKQKNTITAQGRTDPNENTGITLQNCQIVAGSDLVPVEASIPTYLGRPWKLYSRTVVMQSFIDKHVNPKGWLPWDGDFALSTLYYGEYQNRGPGAGTAGRVNWPGFHVITSASVANSFTVAALIQGGEWLSSTGVAFTEGLM